MQQPIWVDAMVEDYDSIFRNNAWEIVPILEDKSVVGSRWIYKVKQETYGSVKKHKAIFVAKGFSQVEAIDYEDTFLHYHSTLQSDLFFHFHLRWDGKYIIWM